MYYRIKLILDGLEDYFCVWLGKLEQLFLFIGLYNICICKFIKKVDFIYGNIV